MRIYAAENYEGMCRKAAERIAALVVTEPDCVLGLATGSTPVGIYDLLSRWCAGGHVSFSRVRTVNLDEYLGLGGTHPQSYRYYMEHNLFRNVDIRPEHTHLPDGTAPDLVSECLWYDELIASLGGIRLLLLGLGHNGHIGFNEPGNAFVSGTHVVELEESTIRANSRLFDSADEVPHRAVTMGMRDIIGARSVLLVVSGASKAEAVSQAFSGSVTPQVPASILQLHPDVTLVADKAALSLLAVSKERTSNNLFK